MSIKATIFDFRLRVSKAGSRGVIVSARCEDEKLATMWIGEQAPDWVAGQWWGLINANHGWSELVSLAVFDLIGKKIICDCEENKYGYDMKKLIGLDDGTVPDDDIPF